MQTRCKKLSPVNVRKQWSVAALTAAGPNSVVTSQRLGGYDIVELLRHYAAKEKACMKRFWIGPAVVVV
jgi:hypothetical protein